MVTKGSSVLAKLMICFAILGSIAVAVGVINNGTLFIALSILCSAFGICRSLEDR